MNRVRVIFVLFLSLIVSSCATNPVTGKNEFSIIGAEQEVSMGAERFQPYQQQQGGRYSVDPELNLYVNNVGQKLARVSDRPNLPYEFVVLNNSVPNAWALPGGKIAINRGLLNLMDDEAQLASVLAHEIVHAAARHSANQMTKQTLLGVGIQAVGLAAQGSQYSDWITKGAGLGANAWQASYSREHESEADEYSILYLSRAGYDVYAAVELQQKFVELSKGRQSDWLSNLFASHPPSQQRVDQNKERAAKYPKGGTRNRQAYQNAIRQIKKDKKAYDLHSKSLQSASKGDVSQALKYAESAISLQPNEALFHVTKGQLLMDQKQTTKALEVFRRAARLNPEYYLTHLGLGMNLYETQQKSAAEQSLNQSMKLLQTPTAAYYLGEIVLAKGDRNSAQTYFQFAAQDKGQIGEAARSRLSSLAPQ